MRQFTIPLEPKPQSRPRFNGITKRAYEVPAVTEYKKQVGYFAKAHFKREPLENIIGIEMSFYRSAPKALLNVKKTRLQIEEESLRVNTKPDLDNYAKAILDALNGIVFKDDNQVAYLKLEKRYSLNPRIELKILSEHEI